MEEKILIEGKKNKGLIKFLTIAPCVLLIVCLWSFVDLYKDTAEWLIDHYHYAWYSQLEFYSGVASFVLTLVFAIIYFYCSKSQITVTEKRVYGCAAFGKRVDLPIDSISAVSIGGVFSQIAVATASGLIHFYLIENHTDVHKTISELLVNRQRKSGSVIQQVVNQTSAKELKEYKELLDSGVISQEEFDAKKKQLLGL